MSHFVITAEWSETHVPGPETLDLGSRIRKLRLKTQDPEPEAQDPEPMTKNLHITLCLDISYTNNIYHMEVFSTN